MRAIAMPILALATSLAIGALFLDDLPSFLKWLYVLAYGLSFSYLAVTCHRLILSTDADRQRSLSTASGLRILRFFVWIVVIYAVKSILAGLTLHLIHQVFGDNVTMIGKDMPELIKQLISLPAMYVLARLSLAFPAAAIDRSPSLRWSWIRTRGNGWRIFIVVGLFPWLMELIIGVAWREDASNIEEAILSLLMMIGMAIEIIALSFVYQAMSKQYASDEPPSNTEDVSSQIETARDAFHDLGESGVGNKLYLAAKVLAACALCYLLFGALASHFVDCQSEVVSSAPSPHGEYKAELINTSCRSKQAQEQGLSLAIHKSSLPNTIYSYPLSKTSSNQIDLAWTGEYSLLITHNQAVELTETPTLVDDIKVTFAPYHSKVNQVQ
ncbi:MAG: hypothetical protein ABL873_01450 [Gallionella sp.]